MRISRDRWGTPMERYLGVILLIAFLLPHSNTAMMLVNPLLCITLLLYKKGGMSKFSIVPIVAILFSCGFGIAAGASMKAYLTAGTLIVYLLAFPFVSGVKIKNIYIYICFGIIFFSQICYIFHWSIITSLLDRLYPITWNAEGIENMAATVDAENYMNYRLGGLYRNPNHLSKYITFLLALFLVNNNNWRLRRQIPFILLCFFCSVLAGSRTGFAVTGVIIIFAIYQNRRTPRWVKWSAPVIGIIAFAILLSVGGEEMRALQIGDGLKDSAGLKLELTLDYIINQANPLQLLFGNLDIGLFVSPYEYSLDCEYGYVIYCFGVLGLFAFIWFFIGAIRHVDKKKRYFFLTMLWMITSSIFMSYRAVFIFLLFFSTLYNKAIPERVTVLRGRRLIRRKKVKPHFIYT